MKAGSQGARFGILVNRLFGLGSQDTPVDLVPELIPTFDAASSRFEYLAPRAEIPFSSFEGAVGVAGEFSFVSIRNPVGSRLVAVVESVEQLAVSAAQAYVRLLTGAVTAAETPLICSDTRLPVRVPTVVKGNGSSAALPTGSRSLTQGLFLGGVPKAVEAVLVPGTQFFLYGTVVNTALPGFTIKGYVRPCTPEEMAV